jgi:hypothetical protein
MALFSAMKQPARKPSNAPLASQRRGARGEEADNNSWNDKYKNRTHHGEHRHGIDDAMQRLSQHDCKHQQNGAGQQYR